MSTAISEQETTINFGREDGWATVWTSDTTMMNKLDRLVEESPEYWKLTDTAYTGKGELLSKTYRAQDKRLISFRKARMVLSDEAKEARALQRAKFTQ